MKKYKFSTREELINFLDNYNFKYYIPRVREYMSNIKDDFKYYYVEVYEYDELIDEVLVDAKDKLIYSYKDENKDYKTNYSNGYFRVKTDGTIQIALNEDKAKFILENKLKENNVRYKQVSTLQKEKIYRYVSNKVDVDKILNNQADICYYLLVNKGLFIGKDVYIVNMYSEKVYKITKDSIEEY